MIREASFKNWMCFRGEHVLHLGPKAYAITARYEIDPGRSNWGGKSALPEGINFAMTGRLAKPRKFDADGWITRGERSGYFQITLDDGTVMRRERSRGKRTEVTMTTVGGLVLTQEDAERAFAKHVGFDVEDTDTIVYFEQDMMNRIVRTEPEKRFDIIRNWLGLQKGEEAEDKASEILKTRVRTVAALKQKRESIHALLPAETEHTSTLPELEEKRSALEVEIEALEAEREKVSSLAEDKQLVERYDALAAEGIEAANAVEVIAPDLEERLRSAEEYIAEQHSAFVQAKQNYVSKKKTSLGLFDGKCPVADIECPATKRINSDRSASKKASEEAKVKEERAEKLWTIAKNGAVDVREEATEAIVKRTRLEDLRARARSMLDDVREARKRVKAAKKEKLRDVSEIDEQLDSLMNQKNDVLQEIAEHKAHERQRASLTEQLEKVENELVESEKLMATATVARATFRAAQRRVAERALDDIGSGANKMLRNANVDLSIDIEWEHEGKGLAKSCEMCGAPFPSSLKVKRCETCNAERGQNITQRLEFLRSDVSGAADDFSGLALQLAAGSYLLRFRQSSWAMAMIDEPFSKMDRTVRRAAAKQLLQLLGAGVYRQLMVISHSQDTVDMYPARINIFVARDGTRSIETT